MRQIKTLECQTYATVDGGRISVTPLQVMTDPVTLVFQVSIDNKASVWKETFGSRPQLDAFLRGVLAGAAMYGRAHLDLPAIPANEHIRPIEALSRSPEGPPFSPGAMPGSD